MKCDELKKVEYPIEWGLYYDKEDVDEAIAELKADNKRLKKCEIWMKQHFFCEEVIARESAKNRRLNRALYKACANWALSTLAWLDCIDQGEPGKWSEMVRKCRAKAEEYK